MLFRTYRNGAAILGSILILCVVLLIGCRSADSHATELDRLDEDCSACMQTGRFVEMDSLARKMESLAIKYNSERYLKKAYFYLGNYIEGEDSAAMAMRLAKLYKAEKMAEKDMDSNLLCQIYNAKGIWELENSNYLTAQYYFKQGLQLARNNEDEKAIYSLEANFSEVGRMLEDTLGMAYDEEIFRHAVRSGNEVLSRAAAFHCARYYLKPGGDTIALKRYLDVLSVNDTSSGLVPMVWARYWLANGEPKIAYEYIRKSRYDKSHEAAFTYAHILNRLNRFDESNEYVAALLAIYEKNRPGYQWISLHKLQALNYRGLALKDKAYASMLRYAEASDSLRTHDLADMSKRHMVEFGTEKLSLTVDNQKQRIKYLWILAGALAIIIFLIVGGGTAYYRKRNKLYGSIVAQYMASKERERSLILQIEQRTVENPVVAHGVGNVQEDCKGTSRQKDATLKKIWNDVQYRMEYDRVWSDPQLTRDSLADMIGCSHTYLTAAIRGTTGMSFTEYVNLIRIDEAKKLLTDFENHGDVPLKEIARRVGFSSLSNFYTLFKAKCGMPPAAFRKTARIVADSD